VYQALIESIVNYGMRKYVRNNYISIKKKIQNKILKIIFEKYSRYHTNYLYNDMNVLPVKELTYKIIAIDIIKNNLTFSLPIGYCELNKIHNLFIIVFIVKIEETII
jgi:hypothetical protein